MTLRWLPGWNGLTEPEAVSYVAAVEAADGEPLEFGVARAINDFVLGCKNDGIWDAIKASCILAGARTLDGALVPLVGTAPTNFNFVAGDYNRETGLVGDGSTKYLDSNRNNNVDPQNSKHLSVYVTSVGTQIDQTYIGTEFTGGASHLSVGSTNTQILGLRNNSTTGNFWPTANSNAVGFMGHSRSQSQVVNTRANNTNGTTNMASQTPFDQGLLVLARNGNSVTDFSDARLAFYSIGESLDLASLDTRVSDLITAIGAAIP